MKEVRLLQLELTNYRNIEHEVYVFNGRNAKIVGENRIGKTNTLEAIYFLLTNYLLDGSSDLNALKPLADTKRVVSVKGTFSVDGKTISLEKRYEENWVKTRGTNDVVLKGHTETYIFNDIEQATARQYHDLLEEHFGFRSDIKGDVDVAQMLSNPLYLGNLGESKDWTALRSFIIKTIGDVTDEEVYAEEPTTIAIKEDLEKALGKTENVKKLYNNDISALKEKIKANEANIELLEKTPKPTDEEVEFAKTKKQEHENNIARLQNGIGRNKEIEELENKVYETKKAVLELNTKEFTAYKQSLGDPNKEVNEEINNASKDLNDYVEKKIELNNQMRELNSEQRINLSSIDSCKAKRTSLLADYHKLDDEKRNVDNVVQSVCPTCGKPLDEDKVKEAKDRYLNGLDEKINFIVSEGKAVAKELADHEAKVKEINDKLIQVTKDFEAIDKEVNARREHIEELKGKLVSNDTSSFVESDELKAMRKNLTDLEEQLLTARQKESENNTKTAELIDEEEKAIEPLRRVIADKVYYDRQMETLAGVRTQLKANQDSLVDVEQKKELLDTFIYTKLHLLDKHVAKVFGDIKFQLIKENINGGFDPVCKPYIFDIENCRSTDTLWKSGSKSEKIITGIAIAEHIKSYLGLTELPYLFDEGGEISTDTFATKFKTNAQIICVKVEDNINKPVVINF